MRSGIIFALMTATVLCGGCTDNSRPSIHASDITGHVVGPNGLPVAGATIVLQHGTDFPPGSAADKPNSGIQFTLPDGGRASVWVASYCDGDTVRLLVDDMEMPSGQFSVIWNGLDGRGRLAPDGVYWFHLVLPDGASRTAVPMLRLGYGDLEPGAVVVAQAIADGRGFFRLDQACLPFGHAFTGTDESGEPTGTSSITRQVRVWALHPDHAAAGSDWVTVDADTGANVTITLRP